MHEGSKYAGAERILGKVTGGFVNGASAVVRRFEDIAA